MAVALVGAGAGLGVGSGLCAQCPQVLRRSGHRQQLGRAKGAQRVGGRARAAVSELVEASQSIQAAPDLTWQIWAGTLAGVTPFVIAGIEFSKRIAAQKRCSVCGGSGLVKKAGSYFRCGNCGGFLPWYSWRRFFKG
ncbi:hypothetical protein M758_8G044400 [Ceratodon purpureus]|nr:hypothetical protein M758_8G044400 [Ceratodon purpureus]